MRKPVVSRLSATLLVLSFAACKSVGVIGYPAEYIDMHSPDHVWITQSDNTVVDLYGPKITGDTLAGFLGKDGQYVEMPVSQIRIMKAREFSPMKTALFAGTVAIGTALIVSRIQGTATNCANFAAGAANNGLIQPCNTTNGQPR